MSTLWPRNKPMQQPPHFRQVGAQNTQPKQDAAEAQARHAHIGAQRARFQKTEKHGARAVVRG